MRRWWAAGLVVCTGCRVPNPAFEVATEATDSAAATTGDASTASPDTGTATLAPTTGDATTSTDPSTTDPGTTSTSNTSSTTSTTNSTSSSSSSSSGTGDSVCGDGRVEGDELCDPGPMPVLEPGACKPTCDGTIASKRIFAAPMLVAGQFDFPGVDERCATAAAELQLDGTFMAMVSDHLTRWAATIPYEGDCSDDWPVRPYTAYFNRYDDLVWITGEIRLLGVEPSPVPGDSNIPVQLHAAIDPMGDFPVWTGMANTWETTINCEDWQGGDHGTAGTPLKTSEFLNALGQLECPELLGLICVEQ